MSKDDKNAPDLWGYCGISCKDCPAYIALRTDDNELRKKTAEEWTKAFEARITPEDINCEGCSQPGRHVTYCEQLCVIRKCAVRRNIKTTCADCGDYPCGPLEGFFKQAPKAKENLEKIRTIK